MKPRASSRKGAPAKSETADSELVKSELVKAKSRKPIRVMLIDDSLTTRTFFKRMLESDRSIIVHGTASNAERGIALLRAVKADTHIDVILLDLQMPGMGGLEALPELLEAAPNTHVMVVSSLTEDGAEATVKALAQGAADTMLKPRPGEYKEDYRKRLLDRIHALGNACHEQQKATSEAQSEKPLFATPSKFRFDRRKELPEVLAIGASTGGIRGLTLMLQDLRPEFDLPILITQHLPGSFIPVFAKQIEKASGRKSSIAQEGSPLRKGEILIAPNNAHLHIARNKERLFVKLQFDPVGSGCMPSVDPMLESLAKSCDGRALAIILSGMGNDGLDGARKLSESGGTIWAQNASSSAVWGMPGAVTKAGLTSYLAPPLELSAAVMSEFARSSNFPAVKEFAAGRGA